MFCTSNLNLKKPKFPLTSVYCLNWSLHFYFTSFNKILLWGKNTGLCLLCACFFHCVRRNQSWSLGFDCKHGMINRIWWIFYVMFFIGIFQEGKQTEPSSQYFLLFKAKKHFPTRKQLICYLKSVGLKMWNKRD